MIDKAVGVIAVVALLLSGVSAKNSRYIVTQRPSTRATRSGRCNTAADVLSKNSATSFLSAVRAARFEPVLSDPANQLRGTLFVPTNAAFAKLAKRLNLSVPQLLANVPLITEIVRYHFVQDETRRLAEIVDGEILQTALGNDASCGNSVVRLRMDGIQTFVDQNSDPANPAGVTKPNLSSCNGFQLHVVDRVLLSCPLATLGQLFLGQAVPGGVAPVVPAVVPAVVPGVVPTVVPPVTVQRPTFTPLPPLPQLPSVILQQGQGQCGSPLQVIQLLQQQGINTQNFQQLIATAGLVDAFNDPTANATIFVPTDEAFAAVLGGNSAVLARQEIATDLLFYLVVPSPVGGLALDSSQLTEGQVLQTSLTNPLLLNCGVGTLTITRPNNGLVVLGGQGTVGTVVVGDQRSCASVIHVVDSLLLPCPIDGITPQQGTPTQVAPTPTQVVPTPTQVVPVPQPGAGTSQIPPVATDATGAFQLAFGDAFARSEANSPNVAEAEADAASPRTAFSEAFATGGQAARSVARANGGERAVARSRAVAGGRRLL